VQGIVEVSHLRDRMLPTDSFAVGCEPVCWLLYADDLVLNANSRLALYTELDMLGAFCTDWDLRSTLARPILVFLTLAQQDKVLSWSLLGAPIASAFCCTYLGIDFDPCKGMRLVMGRLEDSGQKALCDMVEVCL